MRIAARIGDWQERGLIDAGTARALLDDVGPERSGPSFATLAVWLGVLCLCFGAMTFMAANWDEMSRLARMAVLLAGTAVAYGFAGFLDARGRSGVAQAFVLLGCGIFGAAVMMTGQMYHLSGPPSGGVFLWGLGSLIAALLLRSRAALGLAVVLAGIWTWMEMIATGPQPFHWGFLPVWGVLAAATWWMRGRVVAHLCALALLFWVLLSIGLRVGMTGDFTIGYLGMMGGFALVSLLAWSGRGTRVLRGFEGEAAFYAMIGVLGLAVMLWAWMSGEPPGAPSGWLGLAVPFGAAALVPVLRGAQPFDHAMSAVWIAGTALLALLVAREVPYAIEAFSLAVSVWTIRMGARQGWASVGALGYLAFAVTMMTIYATAAQGLLGTSFFYLTSGALLLVGALVVPRVMRIGTGETA